MPPSQLPFLGTEAIEAGLLTRHSLLNQHDRLYRNVYLQRDVELTAEARAIGAWLWSEREATLGGLSAASLHGSGYIDAHLPAELFRRNGKKVKGILIHRDELLPDEEMLVKGVSV